MLSNTLINDEGMGILANSIQSIVSMLKIVDLSRTFNVTEAEWQRFLPTLGNANYVVEELTLSHNYIEDESMTIFGNALARELSAVTPRVMNCSMQLQICSLLIPK